MNTTTTLAILATSGGLIWSQVPPKPPSEDTTAAREPGIISAHVLDQRVRVLYHRDQTGTPTRFAVVANLSIENRTGSTFLVSRVNTGVYVVGTNATVETSRADSIQIVKPFTRGTYYVTDLKRYADCLELPPQASTVVHGITFSFNEPEPDLLKNRKLRLDLMIEMVCRSPEGGLRESALRTKPVEIVLPGDELIGRGQK